MGVNAAFSFDIHVTIAEALAIIVPVLPWPPTIAIIDRTHKQIFAGPLVDEHLAAGGELPGRLQLAHAVSLNPCGPGC